MPTASGRSTATGLPLVVLPTAAGHRHKRPTPNTRTSDPTLFNMLSLTEIQASPSRHSPQEAFPGGFSEITNMIEKFPICGNQTNYSFPCLLQDADERCAGGWDID